MSKKKRVDSIASPIKLNKKKQIEKSSTEKYFPFLSIAFITFIAFLPLLKANFINFDDQHYVYQNNLITSFDHLKKLLTTPVQGNFHPLTMLSLAFNYCISGYNAWSYHLFNILLHILNTFLVFNLTSKLSNRNKIISFTSALLFGIHPMHVESVAWVAERKDVLYGLFYLLGLISYIKYVDINSRKNYYLCILWFIFSLLSKPAAVVFPLTLFTLDLFRRRKLSLKLIIEKAPFFILAVTIGLLTYYFQAKNGSTELNNSFSIKEQFFFGFYGFMIYFIKFILPFNLAPFYPFPSSNESLPVLFYLSPLFFILVTVLCILKFKKSNVFAFGFSFYFINLLLVLQFYIVGFAIIADRYTYIPYIGLFYMTGWLIDKWKGPYLTRAIGYILIPGIIFSILTYNQSSKWENSTLLWDYSLKVQPSYKAYISLGMALQDDGNLERAKFCYDEIIKLYPDSSDAYFNRGTLLANEGKYTEALLDYDKCAKLKPDYSIVYYNRGNLKAALNKDSEAYNDLSHSIMLQPDFAEAYINRGIILAKKEKYDEALKDYNQGLKIKPDFYLAYYNRAKLLQATFRYKESIDDFTKTISLKNDYAPAYFDRGIIQCNNGIKDAGCADLQHSISLGFQQAVEVYNRLCK